jgi:hypothetical protein
MAQDWLLASADSLAARILNIGFNIDIAPTVTTTTQPDAEALAVIREPIAREIADAYPGCVKQVFPHAA